MLLASVEHNHFCHTEKTFSNKLRKIFINQVSCNSAMSMRTSSLMVTWELFNNGHIEFSFGQCKTSTDSISTSTKNWIWWTIRWTEVDGRTEGRWWSAEAWSYLTYQRNQSSFSQLWKMSFCSNRINSNIWVSNNDTRLTFEEDQARKKAWSNQISVVQRPK